MKLFWSMPQGHCAGQEVQLQQQMVVSGQLYAPAALAQRKATPPPPSTQLGWPSNQ